MPHRFARAALAVAFLALGQAATALAEAPVGKPAPDFKLSGLAGNTQVTLSGFKGQVVLVDFWASWCAPCKRTLPALHRLKSELPSAVFLAISVDESRAKAKRFLEVSDPEGLITLLDSDGKVAASLGIEGMPAAVLVDRKGMVRFRHDGYTERDMDKIKIELQVLLKENG